MTRPIRFFLVAAATLVVLAGVDERVSAHSGIQSYVYVSIGDSSVDGRVEYPAGDLGRVLGLDLRGSTDSATEVALDNADAIRAYTEQHLALAEPDGSEWKLSFTDEPYVLPVAGGYVVMPFTVEDSFDGAPREFRVDYDGIFHANPERDALFLIENDWGTARFDNEADHLVGFSVGMTSQLIELDDVGSFESMRAVRGLGTDAVREGIDHVFFVVALMLPAALVSIGSGVRGPAPTVGNATRRAVSLLGVHVVASSVVLWALGLVDVDISGALVETIVAGSVLVMAAYAVWRFTTRELAVVAVLGVAQGLGFAADFVDRRLDRVDTPLALLAFNVGIVIAVATVAVLVFPLLLLLRRTPLAAAALFGTAAVISAYALAWLIDRSSIADVDVARVANPFRVWPRNLWLMLLAWALAGGLYAWTARRGALRAVEGESDVVVDHPPMVMS